MAKRLVFHIGYHKTGSSSLQKWLVDHKDVLSEHLLCYNLADGSSNPLKLAVHSYVIGQKDRDSVIRACRDMVDAIRKAPQDTVLYTDEGILGMPLGFSTGTFVESGIYPRAREVAEILGTEFAEFSPVFVAYERGHHAWLKSLHNQMLKQRCFKGSFEEYLTQFDPDPDWAELRNKISQGLGDNGTLVTCDFEDEFALPRVWDMTLLQQLELPKDVQDHCSETLEVINPSMPLGLMPPPVPWPVIILGGSNSMIQNGWVHRMRLNHTDWFELENLSIGACTTAMGLYRLLSAGNLPSGAPVIWEYGVNDFNHFANGQSLESLLYHLHCLARVCIAQKRPLLPVLMSTKRQMLADGEDIYHRRVRLLFENYGIEVLDCRDILRELGAGPDNMSKWYMDDAYYHVHSAFIPTLIQRVKLALPKARIPDEKGFPDPAFANHHLEIHRPDGPAPVTFENSVLSVETWPLTAPIPVPARGRLLAAIITTCANAGLVSAEVDGKPGAHYATQINLGPQAPETQLRHVLLWQTARDRRQIEQEVTVVPLANSARPVVQNMFVWNGHSSHVREDALVGLLVETDTTDAS